MCTRQRKIRANPVQRGLELHAVVHAGGLCCGLCSHADGNMAIGQVSGKQFQFREGKGVTSSFLEYQLTDGKPLSQTDDLWIPYKRTAINTMKTSSGKIKNIHVNNFYPEVIVDKSDAGIEASEVYISYYYCIVILYMFHVYIYELDVCEVFIPRHCSNSGGYCSTFTHLHSWSNSHILYILFSSHLAIWTCL